MSTFCGIHHSLYLTKDGTVFSFGNNDQGQLGLEAFNDEILIQKQISTLPKISSISCGLNFTICLDYNGKMWSFGENNYGQLGIGHLNNQCTPKKIEIPQPILSISCGYEHVLCISEDYSLWSFGSNKYGQLCLGYSNSEEKYPKKTQFTNITNISAGYGFSLFQCDSKKIYSCGFNCFGQLGLGHNYIQSNPISIPNLPKNIVKICSGGFHTLLLDNAGSIFSFGFNSHGQLGLGHNDNKFTFTKVQNIPKIQFVSCGLKNSFLLDTENNLWAFGDNSFGQLGINSGDCEFSDCRLIDSPLKVNSCKNIVTISGGCNHSISIDKHGNIFPLGSNKHGQLGNFLNENCETNLQNTSKDEKKLRLNANSSQKQHLYNVNILFELCI